MKNISNLIMVLAIFALVGIGYKYLTDKETLKQNEFRDYRTEFRSEIDSLKLNIDSLKVDVQQIKFNTDTLKKGQQVIYQNVKKNETSQSNSFFDNLNDLF